MFDIGGPELFFLLVLALLIFGPRRLPQIGRQLGGFVAQMRHAMRDVQGTLEREVALDEVKGALSEVQGMKRDASAIARELAGFGPPPYVDPNRRREAPSSPPQASPETAASEPAPQEPAPQEPGTEEAPPADDRTDRSGDPTP